MKNIFLCIFLFLAQICGTDAMAQEKHTNNERVYTRSENVEILRQTINRPITRLQAKGSSAVILVYDSANYIDVVFNPEESDPIDDGSVSIKGTTLTIDDKTGEAVYKVHLKEADLQLIDHDRKATIIYSDYGELIDSTYYESSTYDEVSTANLATQQALESARQALQESREQLRQSRERKLFEKERKQFEKEREQFEKEREQFKQYSPTMKAGEIVTDTFFVVDSLFFADDDSLFWGDMPIEVEMVADDENVYTDNGNRRVHKSYYWEERLTFAALGGFVNWGDQWYNGLSKMEGDYNLRTSFSSYLIEAQYAAVMTRHFNLSIGVGYESDVFRFTTPIVGCSPAGLFYDEVRQDYGGYDNYLLQNVAFDGTLLSDWSSRLVTCYVSLPVGIGFRGNDLHIEFTALPAIGINSGHTGLVQELNNRRVDARLVDDISKHLRPYKLDLRAELRYRWLGVYAQVATMSVFEGNGLPDIYPFKLGFIMKFNFD